MAKVTGDELNYLNGKYAISAPSNSVPVMKLIKYHRPYSEAALEALISSHVDGLCACGVKSQGDISVFAKHLYDSQWKEWREYRYSKQDCLDWQYNLFIRNSMKGRMMELKALELLRKHSADYEVSLAEDELDEKYRVDILLSKGQAVKYGIQVKPESFKYARASVQKHHKTLNEECPFPVKYLYYNKNMDFTNYNILRDDLN